MVYHDHDGIKTIAGQREIGHEIHSERAKKSRRSARNREERRLRRLCSHLELLTSGTSSHIILNKGGQSRPPIRKTDIPCRSQCTRVACYRIVVTILRRNAISSGTYIR